MKAMIFAAGIGKRLQPISHHTPKALVKPGPQTMLELVARKLIRFGVSTIVVNVHHHHEILKKFISDLYFPGVELIISDESDLLLDTGGGLLNAKKLLEGSEPVILHNVDVLSDLDLGAMVKYHLETKALATLAVTRRTTSRYFLFENGQLAGWENSQTGQKIFCRSSTSQPLQKMAFSGIHVIDQQLLTLITERGVFAINNLYLRLAKNHKVISFEHSAEYWADIGTPEKLETARKLILKHPEIF